MSCERVFVVLVFRVLGHQEDQESTNATDDYDDNHGQPGIAPLSPHYCHVGSGTAK